jgi:hypothetical protein
MKQVRRGMINCAALILFGAGMCQAGQTNGAILEIKGTVTQTGTDFPLSQSVDLVVNDGAIHSGTPVTVPPAGAGNASNCNNTTDQVQTDAYILQAASPTGCDPGDRFEGTALGDGHFKFTQTSIPAYEFDITTHYQCSVNSDTGACLSAPTLCSTGSSGICSGDSGFLTVTNNGGSTFTGTITLSGTSPNMGICGGVSSDSETFSEVSFGGEDVVQLTLAQDSSGCGGFTGTISSGPPQSVPVGTGGTVHLLQNAPVTQDMTFPKGTVAPAGESITDALMFEDCNTLNATLVNGSPGNNPNFSGGSPVPAGTQFTPIAGGSCPVIMNQCSILCAQNPTYPGCTVPGTVSVPLTDCKGITVPKGSLITMSSNFIASNSGMPAYLIASDVNFDWANISNRGGTSFVPGCIKPPCRSGGGSGGLNGREALADLNQSCQLLTYTFNQTAVLPGDDAQVTGILKFCPLVVGEQTFFGVLIGKATLRLEGPLNPNCADANQIMPLTSFPVFLWPGFNQPFSFEFDVPSNACHGTSLKVTSVISSGTVNYVVDGPAINVQ